MPKAKAYKHLTSEEWDEVFRRTNEQAIKDLGLDKKPKKRRDAIWYYPRRDPTTGLIPHVTKPRKRSTKKPGTNKNTAMPPVDANVNVPLSSVPNTNNIDKMDTSKQGPLVVGVKRSSDWYELDWNDGFTGRYPYVWLRDNCRCSACYYPSSKQRSVLISDIDVDIQPEREEINDHGQELKIFWPDNHVSPFPSKWLYLNRFDKTQFDPVTNLVPKAWGSEMINELPKFGFKGVMEDSGVLRDWLRSLVVSGIAVLTGAPKETGTIEELGKRVGHLRTTMYGHTFQVLAIASSSNLAYTTLKLGLHVDLPIYELPPSVQMLHCIKQCQTVGGESQFCDAMKVTNDLKESNPGFYDTLTRVKVDIRLRGKDYIPYHYQYARPIIELDDEGKFKAITHNNGVRAPYINIPVADVKTWYKSLACLDEKLNDKENMIQFKLKEGEVVTFNNNRVMHGRGSFQLAQTQEGGKKTRHLEGGYLGWDVIKSCLRLLDEELDDIQIF